jgi:hypothetical protein
MRRFVKPEEFEPEVLDALIVAFNAALEELNYSAPRLVLEVIAGRMMAAAREGERGPGRLKRVGLVGLPRD